jgi:hypothetical protein
MIARAMIAAPSKNREGSSKFSAVTCSTGKAAPINMPIANTMAIGKSAQAFHPFLQAAIVSKISAISIMASLLSVYTAVNKMFCATPFLRPFNLMLSFVVFCFPCFIPFPSF